MPSMSKDMSNNSTNQRGAQNCSIVGSNKKKYIYSRSMRTNRNELIRRLLYIGFLNFTRHRTRQDLLQVQVYALQLGSLN